MKFILTPARSPIVKGYDETAWEYIMGQFRSFIVAMISVFIGFGIFYLATMAN